MASYTPGFQWSLPDQQEPPGKPSPATTKPIANPLLSQQTAGANLSLRVPFSPVENNGLRQRRQQEASLTSTHTYIPVNGKRPVRPPTATFLMNGNVGISNERAAAETTTFERTVGETVPQLGHESFKRCVVVYGYTNESQYQAILRRFQTFGRVVSHRGGKPGLTNWVALEYESVIQAEKALCQQNCLLMDGILVGVTGLTLPLKQSLEWNHSTSLSSLPDVTSRLDSKFETDELKEEDILLLSPSKNKQSFVIGEKRNVCERFLSWWFGWA